MWKMSKSLAGHRMLYGACALNAGSHKATDTHLEYVILIAFILQQWLFERAPLLRNTSTAYLVIIMFLKG